VHAPWEKISTEGVVDRVGRVFKRNSETPASSTAYYDGFYVVDDSIIPNALGVNPSLTIAALASRITEEITNKWSLIEL
jgi:cholesterol oxidase